MTKEDYVDYKWHLMLNNWEDLTNLYVAITFYFNRMWTQFSSNNITAQQGLFLFHMFLAKFYREDWDFRVVSAVALYIATKHKTPMSPHKFKDLTWKILEADFQIKIADDEKWEDTEHSEENYKLLKLHNNDKWMMNWLGTWFVTIETKMLEISDFDIDFEVPYTYLSNFHNKYKAVSEKIYTKLHPNIKTGSELEFNCLWDFFMNTKLKINVESWANILRI